MRPNPLVASLLGSLTDVVGADQVLVDDDLRAGYERDWTGRYGGPCTAVVRPGSTAEVAAVLAACNEAGARVIPQAGNTGLVGGSVPRAVDDASAPGPADIATVVLSLRRLDSIGNVDTTAMALTAGAGATVAQWQAAAADVGLDSPIDFAARDSATVGGAIATNAGGSRVVRFGTMRRQVLGVEAVLADGTVVGSLAGLPKETVGLHWPSLVCGSEGTLAVITAARLRLVARFAHVTTMLVAVDSVDAALGVLAAVRRNLGSLDSIEVMFPEAITLVADHIGTECPLDVPAGGAALLIECADHVDPGHDLFAALSDVNGIAATAVATGGRRRHRLLAFRDRVTEAIASVTRTGPPTYKLDIAVPLAAIAPVLDLARTVASREGARLITFGHLAEGNLHLNFLDAHSPKTIAEQVLPAVAELHGTISAEHGIGVAKTGWLHLIRDAGDLAAQRAVRTALDPRGTLNPGVLDAGHPTT